LTFFEFGTKLRSKIKRRLNLYRVNKENRENVVSFRDFLQKAIDYASLKRVSSLKKAAFVVIISLLLSTEQFNFMTAKADFSLESEYIANEDIFMEKPMVNSSDVINDIIDYVVQSGDTLDSLTEKFHISASTITVVNKLKRNPTLEEGQKLKILPVTGLLHIVRKDDSIALISGMYDVPAELVMYQNNLSSDKELKVGQELIIPNGVEPAPAGTTPKPKNTNRNGSSNGGIGDAPTGKASPTSGTFNWPATCRVITRGFNPAIPHWGIDCANSQGTPIYAAESGTVIKASVGTWGGGYGNHVIIDHGNGITTIYGHLYKVGVSVGQHVERGEGLGLMGTTGNSTGPHLHFEVVVNGKKTNPNKYL
jgi:murein DD-endopeptidase MepM/ murein hydrolase activator NlpD